MTKLEWKIALAVFGTLVFIWSVVLLVIAVLT